MSQIRSFDVFDTLFSRRYITSDIIWQEMERLSSIPNFAINRKAADTGHRNLKQIYETMASDGHIASELVDDFCELEISSEKATIFPIKENIEKVRHGDLLISVMYMSGRDIFNLVRSVGMDKLVTIYQSNGDKATGAFWDRMKGKLNLEYHLGDNAHSDYKMPLSRGFNAVHYPNGLTNRESYLIENGMYHLGLLLREIRLRNYEEIYAPLFGVANQDNLFWLFIACEMIKRKHNGKKIVFLGRDCQLMHKIYNAYFFTQSYYLPFSREVAMKQPEEAAHYLKHFTTEDSVLVDISSTGRTWEIICEKHPFNVEVMVHSDTYWYSEKQPVIPSTFGYMHRNSIIGNTSIVLEIFNCGNHGKIKNVDIIDGVPICKFGETELPKEAIKVIHKPIDDAVALKDYYKNIVEELSQLDWEELEIMSASMMRDISNIPKDFINVLNPKDNKYIIDEFDKKEAEYLDSVS